MRIPRRSATAPFTAGTDVDYGNCWPTTGSTTGSFAYMLGYIYFPTWSWEGTVPNQHSSYEADTYGFNVQSTSTWPFKTVYTATGTPTNYAYGPRKLGDIGPLWGDNMCKETTAGGLATSPNFSYANHVLNGGPHNQPLSAKVLGTNMVLTDGSARFYSYPNECAALTSQFGSIKRDYYGGKFQP